MDLVALLGLLSGNGCLGLAVGLAGAVSRYGWKEGIILDKPVKQSGGWSMPLAGLTTQIQGSGISALPEQKAGDRHSLRVYMPSPLPLQWPRSASQKQRGFIQNPLDRVHPHTLLRCTRRTEGKQSSAKAEDPASNSTRSMTSTRGYARQENGTSPKKRYISKRFYERPAALCFCLLRADLLDLVDARVTNIAPDASCRRAAFRPGCIRSFKNTKQPITIYV